MHTLDSLGKNAELNLCERCQPVYRAVIEPTVKAMLDEFFFDWQGVETHVRFILAKTLGAFKKRPYLLDIGKEEPLEGLADSIDIKLYDKIRRKWFSTMVDDLKHLGIIGPNLHALLLETAKRRNKVHRYMTPIPESDRVLFYWVNQFVWNIQNYMMDESLAQTHLPDLLKTLEIRSQAMLAEIEKDHTNRD